MAKKKKKKTRSAASLHKQVQDSLQALPYVVDEQRKQGHRFKALFIKYLSSPILRLMNAALNAKRYRGKKGDKLRQTEQMKRHLEQKQAAIRHVQTHLQSQQRKRR